MPGNGRDARSATRALRDLADHSANSSRAQPEATCWPLAAVFWSASPLPADGADYLQICATYRCDSHGHVHGGAAGQRVVHQTLIDAGDDGIQRVGDGVVAGALQCGVPGW